MIKKVILALTGFSCSVLMANAATITSVQDGTWEDTATWAGGILPTSADQARIDVNDNLTLSSTQTVGALAVDRLGANLEILNGGVLTTTSSNGGTGNFFMDDRVSPHTVSIADGGSLVIEKANIYTSRAGLTNSILVSGAFSCSGYLQTASKGGTMLLSVEGDSASVSLNTTYFQNGSDLRFVMTADGGVSAIASSGNFTLQGDNELIIDMSAMDIDDVGSAGSQVKLIDAVGSVDTWSSVTLLGDSSVTSKYQLSYTGGDGNDLALQVVPEPATLGLIVISSMGILIVRRVASI